MDLSDFEKILDCKHLLVSSGLKSVPLQDKNDFAYYLRAFELLIENEPSFVEEIKNYEIKDNYVYQNQEQTQPKSNSMLEMMVKPK